jgi:glycosyltransferase involved in cell wall biosynthesis
MISVIIPTYKEPEALDICLKSAIEGQERKNQLIVVVDGFYDLNKSVLNKYANDIDILNLETNVGTCRGSNLGVYNAQSNKILIVNDDNVFPSRWDTKLESVYKPGTVVTPNQIEPYPSMFRQFIIRDLGRDPSSFDLKQYWDYENNVSENKIDESGSTFPIFMDKYDYLKVGSFSEDYPSPSGFVADWDFFMRCQKNGLKMLRTYSCQFYHFVSVSTKSAEQVELSKQYEINCHEYAKYKWGSYIKHNPENNLKFI